MVEYRVGGAVISLQMVSLTLSENAYFNCLSSATQQGSSCLSLKTAELASIQFKNETPQALFYISFYREI